MPGTAPRQQTSATQLRAAKPMPRNSVASSGFSFRSRIHGTVIGGLLALCLTGCYSPASRSSPLPPAAHERHVALERQPNFRDLGGYKTSDGRSIKWGLLYRSGALSKLTEADLEKLQARK